MIWSCLPSWPSVLPHSSCFAFFCCSKHPQLGLRCRVSILAVPSLRISLPTPNFQIGQLFRCFGSPSRHFLLKENFLLFYLRQHPCPAPLPYTHLCHDPALCFPEHLSVIVLLMNLFTYCCLSPTRINSKSIGACPLTAVSLRLKTVPGTQKLLNICGMNERMLYLHIPGS